jgi:hypothetical protein
MGPPCDNRSVNPLSGLSRRAFVGASAATLLAQTPNGAAAPAPAPLFRDPIFDGASDPVVIWNRQEKNWWLLYTQRPCDRRHRRRRLGPRLRYRRRPLPG